MCKYLCILLYLILLIYFQITSWHLFNFYLKVHFGENTRLRACTIEFEFSILHCVKCSIVVFLPSSTILLIIVIVTVVKIVRCIRRRQLNHQLAAIPPTVMGNTSSQPDPNRPNDNTETSPSPAILTTASNTSTNGDPGYEYFNSQGLYIGQILPRQSNDGRTSPIHNEIPFGW